ncbi:MAG: lipoyl(octanoyl) transferase LipB [Bdellovibrionia bacterium]
MQFWSLNGLSDYDAVREFQLKLVELRSQDMIEDTVLFLEHQPVITRGRGLQFTGASSQPKSRHMPITQPLPEGIRLVESERGGDLTYHGPGQLVIYPICKMDGSGFAPNHDVEGFLRKLENIVIDELGERGLTAHLREKATGVWVGEKKIASMGIAVRKWVSYHGIAINCVNDLRPFHLISPCGFSSDIMTRLSDCLPPTALATDRWRSELEQALARRMGAGPVKELASIASYSDLI